MTRPLPFILILALSVPLIAADPAAARRHLQAGIALLKEKKYDEAIEAFEKAADAVPENPLPPYNIACAYALKGEKEKAVTWLQRSAQLGFAERGFAERDTDLAAIRGEPGYRKALGCMDENARKQYAEMIEKAKEDLAKGYQRPDGLFAFDFDLVGIDGKPLRLRDLRGKIVLVDIWGTWCPPCRRYVPHLIELWKRHHAKGVEVVGLNFERTASGDAAKELVARFVKEQGIPYRCALPERALLQKVPGFRGFPTSLLVDHRGKVRLLEVGYRPYQVVEAVILEALKRRGGQRERF